MPLVIVVCLCAAAAKCGTASSILQLRALPTLHNSPEPNTPPPQFTYTNTYMQVIVWKNMETNKSDDNDMLRELIPGLSPPEYEAL